MASDLLTIPYLSGRSGLSKDVIRARARRGEIECVKAGPRGHYYFTAEPAEKFLKSITVGPRSDGSAS
jgi:hypothetical protein